MQLWEAGHVRLDDPLTADLPWARPESGDEDSVPISLRALLSHSAGLPRESDFPYWTGPDFPFPTEAQLRAKLAQQTPLWSASRWYQYSNLCLALIGSTVSAVSGEPYAEYVQTHILDPLGLKDTHPFMPMDEVRFERDNAGRVYRFVEFSNAHDRLAEVSSGEPNKQ
jgi:CubicO group peptidase (beta-lactamase class C family)